jgi:hypothetical protein
LLDSILKAILAMKNKLYFLLLSCVGFLTSCSSNFYQLRPVSGDVAWLEGREVTRTEQNGVVLVASYEFEDPNHMVLDVEIKNRTSAPLLDTLRNERNPIYASFYRAADPEQKIQQAILDVKREKRRLVASSILNGVLLVATVASDIHSSRNDRSWQQRSNSQYAHAQAYNFIIQKQIADVNLQKVRTNRLEHERANWQELALRKTTLPAGESVRGLLFLPKDTRATYLLLNYESPADSTTMKLKFLQEKIKAK